MSLLFSLLRVSRPRFWLYLAGPFLIGFLSGAGGVNDFRSPLFWLFLFYFLVPANLFLYGINDLADGDTDQFNDKKKGYEQTLQSSDERSLRIVLWSCVALTMALAYFSGSLTVGGVLGVFLFLSYAYSQLPFRWKARPIIDSASNVLYVLPGVLGFVITSGEIVPLWVILGCGLWTAAMHLFSAIPDIEADTKAHLKTTAVVLGERSALLCCSLLWFCSAVILLSLIKVWWILPMFVYSLMPMICLLKFKTPAQLYRIFPYLNGVLGFLLFWSIFLYRF